MSINKKKCSKCGEFLDLSCFSRAHGGKNIYRPECKRCNAELARQRKLLKEKHGTAPPDHICPICQRGEEELKGSGGRAGVWVLDHCHTTNQFRGFICHQCNRGLGLFKDSVDNLKRAQEYLKAANKKTIDIDRQDGYAYVSQ